MSKRIKEAWGRLSSSLKKSKESEKIIKFDGMNIKQLLEYSAQIKNNFTWDTAKEMIKRLFEIAFYDYDASDKDRQMAKKLLGAVIKDVENSLSSNPEALQALKTANQYTIDGIELFGIGSLNWQIRAPGVSEEEVIKMIIDPSSGPLIPNFLKAMGEEEWSQLKGAVIKALILDRRYGGESNAVLILSGLIAGTDLVAWNIMNTSERSTLMGVSKNYKNARDVLVKYGLLPSKSSALPMTPQMPDEELAGIVLISTHDRDDSIWPSNITKMYELFDEDQKAFISVNLFIIKIIIFLDLIRDVYGKDVALEVETNVMDNLKESSEKRFKDFLETIRSAEEMALSGNSGLGIDKIIASGLMDFYIPKGLSEEKQVELRDIVAEIFNIERRSSLHKFRFYLRFFANKGVEHSESLKKYNGDLYRHLSSRVGELEKGLLFEDWIGES
jgi:hypothetical protein